MRPDMAKVVTERPRSGHGDPSIKTALRVLPKHVDAEDVSTEYTFAPIHATSANRHPISRRRQHGWNGKQFSDLLGPLKRYLRKQVGRLWDDVYSELTAHLDRRSLAGIHIWSHVESEVELHTRLDRNGVVQHSHRYGGRYGSSQLNGLYVHPVSRRLCYVPYRRPRYRSTQDEHKRLHIRVINKTTELERVDGIWYIKTYKLLDPNEIVGVFTRTDGVEVPIRRCDMKTWPKWRGGGDATRELVSTRQLGKRHKLWAVAQAAPKPVPARFAGTI